MKASDISMKHRSWRVTAIMAMIIALGGCQAAPRPDRVDAPTATSEWPSALPDGRRYVVDRDASALRIVVLPDGPLARFGHPHVIGGAVIDGTVVLAEPFVDSALELRINVAELEVDRPSWREDEGFDPDMEASAIAGTRANLLSPAVLDADAHPQLEMRSLSISGPSWQPDVELAIRLVGQTRALTVPISLDIEDEQLTATGQLRLAQSDFGIQPFSAAGGTLRVADDILVRFRIVARSD